MFAIKTRGYSRGGVGLLVLKNYLMNLLNSAVIHRSIAIRLRCQTIGVFAVFSSPYHPSGGNISRLCLHSPEVCTSSVAVHTSAEAKCRPKSHTLASELIRRLKVEEIREKVVNVSVRLL